MAAAAKTALRPEHTERTSRQSELVCINVAVTNYCDIVKCYNDSRTEQHWLHNNSTFGITY